VIVEEPELQPDKYGNAGHKVLVLSIRDDDGVIRRLYARSKYSGAIGHAVTDTGVDEIECGGRLAVEYSEDKPTGTASSAMKIYLAEYQPPSPVGRSVLGADEVA